LVVLICAPAVLNAPASKTLKAKALPPAKPVSLISGEMLREHNSIRSRMSLPALQWSSELAAFSQRWADTLIAKNRSAHNPNSPYGENILVTGPGANPARVVQEWASESLDYSYRTNECAGDCGHYTQIIWRSSRKLGCAVSRNDRREVWVCSYDPPGNYRNEWPY
jgi:uncharacterized protein YkwD